MSNALWPQSSSKHGGTDMKKKGSIPPRPPQTASPRAKPLPPPPVSTFDRAQSFGTWASRQSNLSLNSRSKTEEVTLVSHATSQATSAAKSILVAGGTQSTALSTANAAALSILASNKEQENQRIFFNRRKERQQAEVIASMALVSAVQSLAMDSPRSRSSRQQTDTVSHIQSRFSPMTEQLYGNNDEPTFQHDMNSLLQHQHVMQAPSPQPQQMLGAAEQTGGAWGGSPYPHERGLSADLGTYVGRDTPTYDSPPTNMGTPGRKKVSMPTINTQVVVTTEPPHSNRSMSISKYFQKKNARAETVTKVETERHASPVSCKKSPAESLPDSLPKSLPNTPQSPKDTKDLPGGFSGEDPLYVNWDEVHKGAKAVAVPSGLSSQSSNSFGLSLDTPSEGSEGNTTRSGGNSTLVTERTGMVEDPPETKLHGVGASANSVNRFLDRNVDPYLLSISRIFSSCSPAVFDAGNKKLEDDDEERHQQSSGENESRDEILNIRGIEVPTDDREPEAAASLLHSVPRTPRVPTPRASKHQNQVKNDDNDADGEDDEASAAPSGASFDDEISGFSSDFETAAASVEDDNAEDGKKSIRNSMEQIVLRALVAGAPAGTSTTASSVRSGGNKSNGSSNKQQSTSQDLVNMARHERRGGNDQQSGLKPNEASKMRGNPHASKKKGLRRWATLRRRKNAT